MLIETHEEGRLLCDAKGWTLEALCLEIERQAADKPEVKPYVVSVSTWAKRSLTALPLPQALIELIEGLKVLPGRARPTEVVEAGLRAMRGLPQQDQRQVTRALLEQFPTDELAARLADSLSKQAELASASGGRSFLDTFARAVTDRLPHLPSLEELAKRLGEQLEGWTLKRMGVTGAISALTGSLVGCLIVLAGLHSQASGLPPVVVVTNFGGIPSPVEARAYLDDSMGTKAPMDRGLPDGLMPGQKPAKDCNAKAYEVAMRGGCWVEIGSAKPPCGEFAFREEGKCYRPVAVNPNKPVGTPE